MGHSIVFGAYGSAFTITKKNLKRSNGTLEYYKFLQTLCAVPNIDKIYLVSPCDYDTTPGNDLRELDPDKKIVYIWDKNTSRPCKRFSELTGLDVNIMDDTALDTLRNTTSYYCVGAAQRECIKVTADKLKDIKIDLAILYMSQGVSNWNIPDSKKTKFGYGNQNLVMGFNYTAHISYFLNENQGMPYYLVLPVPRWGGNSKWGILIDNFKSSNAVLTQFDADVEWRHVTKYDNTKTTKEHEYKHETVKFEYKETEKVSSIGVEPTSPDNGREITFAIAAMQATPSAKWKDDYRFKELKKWIIDNDPNGDWHIYGKWDDACVAAHKNFKGMISSEEVDATFKNTKYTLIIPIEKNWVTGKYVEMLACGCVTFLHPDYDTQYHVFPKDHILRVKDAKDLKYKIEIFEKYPGERIKLVKHMQEKLLANVTDGSFLIDMLNKTNEEKNVNVKLERPVFKKKKKSVLVGAFA